MKSRLKMAKTDEKKLEKTRAFSREAVLVLCNHATSLGRAERAIGHALTLAAERSVLLALKYIASCEGSPRYFYDGAADTIMHHENQTKAQNKPTITYGRSKGR